MDINNLIAFIAVAEKKSFSRAAESLRLTQPAVSKRVAALETELRTKLFDRIGRNVHLTEAGSLLLPSAQKIQAELSLIETVVRNPDDEVRGVLKIATTERLGSHKLPTMLKRFLTEYPKVELNLQFSETTENLSAIENGTTELALCSITSDDPPTEIKLGSKLKHHDLWHDKLVIVVSKDHPLAAEKQPSLQKLSVYPAVLQPATSSIRKLIRCVFQQYSLTLLASTEANNFDTFRSMISIGLGWAYLPEQQLKQTEEFNSGQLAVLEVNELNNRQRVILVHHSSRTLSSSARAFTEFATKLKAREHSASTHKKHKSLAEST